MILEKSISIILNNEIMQKILAVFFVFVFLIIAIFHEKPSNTDVEVIGEVVINYEIPPIYKTDLDFFLEDIAFKESSNDYNAINSYGYMGKYQFGYYTLISLGYNVTRTEFLNNPDLQEQAMIDLLTHNKEYLINYIEKYDGTYHKGIYITESGILAAAHLAGQGNVRRFFKYGTDFRDGYGTSIKYYMQRFGGYDLDLPIENPLLVQDNQNEIDFYIEKYETNVTL